MSIDSLRWYAVKTKPRQERLAEKALNSREISTFYPVVLNSRSRASRRASVSLRGLRSGERAVMRASGGESERSEARPSAISPYFTGYIFAGLKPGQSLRTINTAYGVNGVVHAGFIPLEVPVWAIEALKAKAEHTAQGWLMKAPQERLKLGARHRICTGSFEGFIAEITRVDIKGRVGVFIQGVANSLPAVLSAFDLGEEISPAVRQPSKEALSAV